jgi:hypothetical protein
VGNATQEGATGPNRVISCAARFASSFAAPIASDRHAWYMETLIGTPFANANCHFHFSLTAVISACEFLAVTGMAMQRVKFGFGQSVEDKDLT